MKNSRFPRSLRKSKHDDWILKCLNFCNDTLSFKNRKLALKIYDLSVMSVRGYYFSLEIVKVQSKNHEVIELVQVQLIMWSMLLGVFLIFILAQLGSNFVGKISCFLHAVYHAEKSVCSDVGFCAGIMGGFMVFRWRGSMVLWNCLEVFLRKFSNFVDTESWIEGRKQVDSVFVFGTLAGYFEKRQGNFLTFGGGALRGFASVS